MNQNDLAEIKARADDVRALLEYGPSVQDLLERDVPKLIAEVERLKEELAYAGKCPHGAHYEDQSCARCFGDGTEQLVECSDCGTQSWHRGGKCLLHDATAPKPYEVMKNELEELRSKLVAPENEELAHAIKCPHGEFYDNRSCAHCFGDGTEQLVECSECGTQSWHRGGKCLLHDATAPKPYEIMKNELEELRNKVLTVEQECAARIGAAEKQVKEIQASREIMREALEYIKPRIGSSNLGESMSKINRALSTSALPNP